MKKVVLIIFSVILLWSCGNKNEFKINGELVPTKDGSVILYGFKDGQPIAIDSSELKNGKFKFKGELDMPELKLIGLKGGNDFIAQFFVEPGKIDMTIYPDSFEANVITGSESQDIFQQYINEMITFQKKENDLQQRFMAAQSTNDPDEINAIRFEYQTIIENTKLYSKNFINKYSTSTVAPYVYLMTFIGEADIVELDSILKVFEPVKDSEFVVAIKERAEVIRQTSNGAIAPDFTLTDPNGKSISLSSFKGKVVLVDFWASWCQPCMIELPNIMNLYKTYKDKGFEIFGVSLDREKDAWLNCIKDKKMDWAQVWDMEGSTPGQTANMYNVTGIPHTVLVGRDGVIIDINLRGEELAAKLAEILK